MDQSGSTGGPGAPTPPTGWSSAPPAAPGPATLVYADFSSRFIAIFIDLIILWVVDFVIFAIVGGIAGYGAIVGLLFALISLAISGAYFVYQWTTSRATVGMKLLKLQVGDAGSGKTIDQNQAIRRWAALFGPQALASAFTTFGVFGFVLGFLIGVAALAWVIFLGYTTAQSPTHQGWHDIFAHTMVVKAANAVA